jgi:carboxymethylenebutenolidase
MKIKIILFIHCFALLIGYASGQNKKNCCKSPTTKFAALGQNEKFVKEHEKPLPVNYSATTGKTIRFKTSSGSDAYGFLVKSEIPSTNYIFVFHEWWGLNDYIKMEAERLQKELGNVNVLAIDLYDEKVAKTPEDAKKIMSELKNERAVDIIKSALLFVGPAAHIENIGWCFGGGWSLQAAIMEGKQNEGCVLYYGMPETEVKKLKSLNSDVLGIFASQDEHINAEIVKKFQEDMQAADKKLTVEVYNADHAFANPSNPKYNNEAAKAARVLALEYLKKRLHQ